MDGAVQGLQEVAGQVVGTRHSLLEAGSLCHLHRLLHVPPYTPTTASHLQFKELAEKGKTSVRFLHTNYSFTPPGQANYREGREQSELPWAWQRGACRPRSS